MIAIDMRNDISFPDHLKELLVCFPKPDPGGMRVSEPRGGVKGDYRMRGKRHTPEQVIVLLRQAEVELSSGCTIGQVCQKLAVSEQTFHRWRNQYGGMKADEMKRLRELEAENARLKKIVADQALDIQMLKETARGNF
jgi:putative transposase